MAKTDALHSELEEQRRLIETQRIEIQRQRRQIEVQIRRSADMQLQLDRILASLQNLEPALHRAKPSQSNGNGHRDKPARNPPPLPC
jgi:hypothetical protein